jgi:hypothetical protein
LKIDKKVGLVTFINQEPREIGVKGITKARESHMIGEFPLIMTFSKKESIDIVIEQLLSAKKGMD